MPICKINIQAQEKALPDPFSYHSTVAVTRAIQKIRFIISKSKVPEDPLHAENTLQILLELKPDASLPLQIAAFGHDIERAFPGSVKVQKKQFASYDDFKRAHALNSARILKGLLLKSGVDDQVAEQVYDLVAMHEFGGNVDADLLKDADSLSFFCVNLPLFMLRESICTVRERIVWGIKRLSPKALKMLEQWCSQGLPEFSVSRSTSPQWPKDLIVEQISNFS